MSEELALYSKELLVDTICGLLGGRLAEEEILGEITNGASDDLEKVTGIAFNMIVTYGMSNLGLQTFNDEGYYKPYSNRLEGVMI